MEGFVSSLTHLTLDRASIKRGMTRLMDAEPKCSEEMALALMKSFTSIEKHSTANLLARLYLVSDVLSNCSKPECRRYSVRTMVEKRLPEAFEIFKRVEKRFWSQGFPGFPCDAYCSRYIDPSSDTTTLASPRAPPRDTRGTDSEATYGGSPLASPLHSGVDHHSLR